MSGMSCFSYILLIKKNYFNLFTFDKTKAFNISEVLASEIDLNISIKLYI